jgi:hypothetical protein
MHRKWLTIVFAALAIGAFAAVTGTASAEETAPGTPPAEEVSPLDETCNSGHVCVWTEFRYQGAKGESLCTGGVHTLAGFKGSAKNRCANKAVWLRENGSTHYCVNPAQNLPEDFVGFNELFIGAEGSRC